MGLPVSPLGSLLDFSLLLSHVNRVLILRSHGLQHARVPILHRLLEFAQIHVCLVGDAV